MGLPSLHLWSPPPSSTDVSTSEVGREEVCHKNGPEHMQQAVGGTYLLNQFVSTSEQRGRHGEAERLGRFEMPSRWGCYHAPPLTDPYVPISSIRFFTGEFRSRRCIDGRSVLRATGAALGGPGSDPR